MSDGAFVKARGLGPSSAGEQEDVVLLQLLVLLAHDMTKAVPFCLSYAVVLPWSCCSLHCGKRCFMFFVFVLAV